MLGDDIEDEELELHDPATLDVDLSKASDVLDVSPESISETPSAITVGLKRPRTTTTNEDNSTTDAPNVKRIPASPEVVSSEPAPVIELVTAPVPTVTKETSESEVLFCSPFMSIRGDVSILLMLSSSADLLSMTETSPPYHT